MARLLSRVFEIDRAYWERTEVLLGAGDPASAEDVAQLPQLPEEEPRVEDAEPRVLERIMTRAEDQGFTSTSVD